MKNKLSLVILIFVSITSHFVNAQDCTSIIPLGNITSEQILDKVKDKSKIDIFSDTPHPKCGCTTVDFITIKDSIFTNYKGVKATHIQLVAYDKIVFEYAIIIEGIDNVNKILDIVYDEHPDIKLMDDDYRCILRKFTDENAVLEINVNDVNELLLLTYTTNAKSSRLFWYSDIKYMPDETVKRISLKKGEKNKSSKLVYDY